MSQDLGTVLHARGLRLTPQRERVLRAVRDLGHATAEDVAAHLDAQGERAGDADGVNTSTVYRALSVLEDVGLLARTVLDRSSGTFHSVEHGDHLHLLCQDCGHVAQLPSTVAQVLAADVAQHNGFVLDTHHLALRGQCARCRLARAPEGS